MKTSVLDCTLVRDVLQVMLISETSFNKSVLNVTNVEQQIRVVKHAHKIVSGRFRTERSVDPSREKKSTRNKHEKTTKQ